MKGQTLNATRAVRIPGFTLSTGNGARCSYFRKGRKMITKTETFKNGHCSMERLTPSGMYLVKVYVGSELRDKVRTDNYGNALAYYRAFRAVAKTA